MSDLHFETEIPEPKLSKAVMADLARYHEHMLHGGDAPMDVRLIVARCMHALADSRIAALTTFEALVEMLEKGRADYALGLVKWMAEHYRDSALPDAGLH